MKKANDKAYFLSPEEIKLILFRYKITGLQLFEKIVACDMNEAMVASALIKLAEKKVLIAEENKFRLSKIWEEIRDVLTDTMYTVLDGGDSRRPETIRFISRKKTVCIQVDPYGESLIKIQYGELESIVEELLQDVPFQELSGGQEVLCKEYEDISLLEVQNNENVIWKIERFPKEKEKADVYIALYRDNLQDVIHFFYDEEYRGSVLYTREAFKNIYLKIVDPKLLDICDQYIQKR